MNVLFFMHTGDISRSAMQDIVEGFRVAGHRTFAWECSEAVGLMISQPQRVAAVRGEVMAGLCQLIAEHKIDLTVSMWGIGMSMVNHQTVDGRPVSFFESIRCPHLMLWYDSPERACDGSMRSHFKSRLFDSPYLFHFINNSETAREMERVYRFSNVLPRGYGINPDLFKPGPYTPLEQRPFDLVFCANFGNLPNPPRAVLDELAKDEPDSLVLRRESARLHWPVFQKCVRFLPPIIGEEQRMQFLRRLLDSQLNCRDTPVLDRVEALCRQPGTIGVAAALMLADPEIFAQIATELRQMEVYERAFLFTYLSRFFKCRLFGLADYQSLGCGIISDGALKYGEQATFYHSGRVGLSVMRWQDERGLHIKPYEMTASGLACVAQHRQGIEEHFIIGEEIETFHTYRGARDVIAALLADPARLQALTDRGHARTMRDHTWAAWANDIASRIQQRLKSSEKIAA